jgi:hypothetical protein
VDRPVGGEAGDQGAIERDDAAGPSYKLSVDQLAFTQMIDLDELAAAEVPCFGTLERAVAFLSSAGPGETYPP